MAAGTGYQVLKTLVSPDGKLTFIVWSDNGGVGLSFGDYPWHTHPEVLEPLYPGGRDAAIEGFVADLVSGTLVIALSIVGDRILDIWVTDDLKKELEYCASDERVEFRLWDGTRVTPRPDV